LNQPSFDPTRVTRIKRLVREFSGGANDAAIFSAAERLAEAEVELRRIQTIRISLTSDALQGASQAQLDTLLTSIARLDRYERRAASRRKGAIETYHQAKLNTAVELSADLAKRTQKD
jgi:hypothetical protein